MIDPERQLAEAVPKAVLALLLSTIVYAVGDFLAPGNFEQELLYYSLASLLPALLLISLRLIGIKTGPRILAADLFWTAIVLVGMCLATNATISGTAYLLSMKWLASAMLLPWSSRLQMFSSYGGCALYFLAWSIAAGDRPIYVHQWALPLVAAVLSVSGSRTLNRSRHAAHAAARAIAESEGQLRSLVDQSPDGILVSREGIVVFANQRLANLLDYRSPNQLIARPLWTVLDEGERTQVAQFIAAASHDFPPAPALHIEMIRRLGQRLSVALTAATIQHRGAASVQITVRDMSAVQRNRQLLEGEREILESIAGGTLLGEQLSGICRMIEGIDPTVVASIQVVGDDGKTLRHGAAPSLPSELLISIAIAEGVGSCGTAAFRRSTVVVEDIASNPLWRDYCHLARAHGLASCWSTPIVGSAGDLLGTFALYRRIAARPDDTTIQLVERTTHLAAIALERQHEARNQSEQAELFGALARVGQVLISSLDRPVLLDRLCSTTAAELHAEVAHVFLREPDEGTFVPVATFGDTPENWEMIRMLHMTREHFGALEERLREDELLQIGAEDLDSPLPAGLQTRFGIRHGMFVALHRGKDLAGVLTVASRTSAAHFSPHQERIARGIAQLASLALENARLHEELARANLVKSNFVATMSHELRTPLNVLIGYPEMLLAGDVGSLTIEQREIVERLIFYARQLLVLVNDTLDLSRLDSGKMPFESRRIELQHFIDRVATEAREAWGHHGIALSFVVSGKPTLHTDPAKLHVILRSLLDNAVKFTPHGSVTLRANNRSDGVEIVVEDTGIGIEPDAQQRIFEPFTQADARISQQYGGAGLGLHIVKRLVELFRGTIRVESQVGHGTAFHVWLPGQADAESAVRT